MGKIEEKIKQDILQDIFTDTFKIYEFIDNRFKLDDKTRDEIISNINSLNNDLTNLLKNTKLS
jgi:hypothetical protein